MTLNPYQGLKQNTMRPRKIPLDRVTMTLNPYQGLKLFTDLITSIFTSHNDT